MSASREQEKPELSVSIVSMGPIDVLLRCLASVYEQSADVKLETFLVAHNLGETHIETVKGRFPAVNVVVSEGIRGYGPNHNLALKQCTGKYTAILNDDIWFEGNIFREVIRFLETHPEVGGVSPLLLNADGTEQLPDRRWNWSPGVVLADELKLHYLFESRTSPASIGDKGYAYIAAGSGALFVVRGDALRKIGYFDERYFLSPDDVEVSIRLRKEGWRICLLPSLKVFHIGSPTLSRHYDKVLPTICAGNHLLLSEHYGVFFGVLSRITVMLVSLPYSIYWNLRSWLFRNDTRSKIMAKARWNAFKYSLSSLEGRKIFVRLSQNT